MELSIIIPAHNEASTLCGQAFADSLRELRDQWPQAEVLLVDDGSSDATVEQAHMRVDRLFRQPHRGKAAALAKGFREAAAPLLLWTDADFSVPASEASRLVEAVESGGDLAIGSRGWSRPGSPLHRKIGSSLFTLRNRRTFGWAYRDTQCGMKAGRRPAVLRILQNLRHFQENHPDRFPGTDALFDVECLLVARQLGLRVTEVPVAWHHVDNRSVQQYRSLLRQIRSDFQAIRQRYRNGEYQPPG